MSDAADVSDLQVGNMQPGGVETKPLVEIAHKMKEIEGMCSRRSTTWSADSA
jgi:hypothetical protein